MPRHRSRLPISSMLDGRFTASAGGRPPSSRCCPGSYGQLLALSTVIILVAYLIFSFPFAEAHDQHAECTFIGPEPVLLTGLYVEFIVGFGAIYLAVYLQVGAVIEEMEQLMSLRV